MENKQNKDKTGIESRPENTKREISVYKQSGRLFIPLEIRLISETYA